MLGVELLLAPSLVGRQSIGSIAATANVSMLVCWYSDVEDKEALRAMAASSLGRAVIGICVKGVTKPQFEVMASR